MGSQHAGQGAQGNEALAGEANSRKKKHDQANKVPNKTNAAPRGDTGKAFSRTSQCGDYSLYAILLGAQDLNLRTTTSQKCEAVPRRARI